MSYKRDSRVVPDWRPNKTLKINAILDLEYHFAIKDFIGTTDKNLNKVCKLENDIVSILMS